MIKILYIMGDGRSGSTLLDSLLANMANSISVGECHRFWMRYYEGRSLCGCGDPIKRCVLWTEVDRELKQQFPLYDPVIFLKQVHEIQYFRNFRNIPELIRQSEWQYFSEIVKAYYNNIARITGKQLIIDSSKSVSWAYLLQCLDFADIRVIHLERNLSAVANSWKKDIRLPEYVNSEEWMPKRSNGLILKSWLKIKLVSRKVRRNGAYLFIKYEDLCSQPETWLSKIATFAEEQLPRVNLVRPNHAIGGNPMRSKLSDKIKIEKAGSDRSNLNLAERIGFALINKFAKLI